MKKIKVLHIISRIDIGGAERQLLNLVSNLDREKYNICIGYFEGEGELKKEFEDKGIKTKKFRFKGPWDISIPWRLYQDMEANRYDIVHTHGFKADLWGGLIAKLVGAPVIISSLHNQEWYLRDPFARLLERFFAVHVFDGIIAISEDVRRFACGAVRIPKEKINKVHYGINPLDIKIGEDKDIRKELGIDKDAPLVGCIGRLIEQKGQKYFIRAAKKVYEEFPQARFLIIGRGRLEKKLKKITQNLGLDSRIIFTGFRKDIYSIIEKSDLIVMTSLWEGFGLVLLEAMAMGKPVVATNTGGIPEIIENGKTGILVPARDSEALAQAIIKVLQDSDLVKKITDTAKFMVKDKFSVEKMIEATDKIYNNLIGQKLEKKIKVLHIIESTAKSGPRYLLSSLTHNLNKEKFKVEVICSALRDRDFYKDILKMREAGIKVMVLPMKRKISPLLDLIVFFKLCFYIKKGKYDIVHTHSSKAGFLGRLSTRLMGVRVIIHTPHCFCFEALNMDRLEKIFYFCIEKFAALFCDKIITVSESQREDILKKRLADSRKVITIENGVDISKFGNNGFDITKKRRELGLNNGSIILGTVGVLNESKGHRYLIEAVSKIIKEGFDTSLIIAGEGILRRDLENLRDNLGLNGRIKLLGFREDIPELFSLMDIFVFPSLWEGMSLALLEAMAAGLPVISTDVHGAVDLIQNNKRGILVQKKDILGLAGAIRYLISNPIEAKRMGQAGQELIHNNYTLEKQISKIEELYINMIFLPKFRLDISKFHGRL